MQRLLLTLLVGLVFTPGRSDAQWIFLNPLDPLGLEGPSKRVSDSIDRAALQLREIQEETDADISRYLVELDAIATEATTALLLASDQLSRALEEVASRAERFEEQVYADSVKLLWRSQCAAEVTLTDTLQRALAQAISNIRRSDPKFVVVGVPAVRLDLQPIEIQFPDQAYAAVKKKEEERLLSLEDGDSASIIFSVYLNLARLARLTQCHYLDQRAARVFRQDYYNFERLMEPWVSAVEVAR